MLIQNTTAQTATPAIMPAGTAIQTPQTDAPSATAPSSTASAATEAAAPSASQLQSAITTTNLAMSEKGLEFSVDASTKQTVVKLIDTKTDTVIGQFPSQQMIDISQAIGLIQQQLQHSALSKAHAQSVPGMLIKQQA